MGRSVPPTSSNAQDGDPHVAAKDVAAVDGTRLRYYVVGHGPIRWIAPPGLGASAKVWFEIGRYLADRVTLVTWDGRGFHGSERPQDQARMGVTESMTDLECIRRAEDWDRFVLGGWSMGVQIALAYGATAPERAMAYVLVGGPFERVIERMVRLPFPIVDRVLSETSRIAARAHPYVAPVARRIASHRSAARALHSLGLIRKNPHLFARVLEDFGSNDWGLFFDAARRLNQESVAHVLASIDVPTLVIAGAKDLIAPLETCHDLHARVPGSELIVIDDASHFLLTEHPDHVADGVLDFLQRRCPTLAKH
jgi:pimeloyl-ACP methyl ester carboxylesterase